MKSFFRLCFFLICASTASLLGQEKAATDSLSALIAQNNSVLEQLARQRKAGVAVAAKPYLAALDEVAVLAAKAANAPVMAAIERERAAALDANELPAKPPADLPVQLLSPHRNYVAAAQGIALVLKPKSAAQNAQFARNLSSLEIEARAKGGSDQLARILEEKQKLVPDPR